MTDDEIRVAVQNGDIIIDRNTRLAWYDDFGDEQLGPFSRVPGVNEIDELGDMPVPGYFLGTDTPTQAQIDDLFRTDVNSLLAAERQALLLRRADALRLGKKPSFPVSTENAQAIAEYWIKYTQSKYGRPLWPDELLDVGWQAEWGTPPLFVKPPPNVAAGSGAADSGSTVLGGTDSGSTIAGGTGSGSAVIGGADGAPPTGWRTPGDPFGTAPLSPNPATPTFDDAPLWMFVPANKVPDGGLPSYLDGLPPAGQAADGTQIFPRGTFEGGVPPAGGCGAGNSARAMQQGSSMIHLKPGALTLPGGKGAMWRHFMYRAFTIGACQDAATSDCENQSYIGVLNVPAGSEKEVAASLGEDPQVAMVEANSGRWRQRAVDDPLFNSQGAWQQEYADQWDLHQIGLSSPELNWPTPGKDPAPIIVAIIDTGLAWNHPDFSLRNLWINDVEIPGNEIDDDMNGYVDDVFGWNFLDHTSVPWDLDGHGTLVASIIAAQTGNGVGVAGVNSKVRIMPLKAVNNAGQSRASYLAEAIVYATNNGARIINLSIGGAGLTRAEQLAIDYATARDVLVIAGAGNEGRPLDNYGPAGARRVLTVAASDAQDKRLAFSNWGPQVDLTAPGENIVGLRAPATDLMRSSGDEDYEPGTNFVGDDQLYYRATGTSFAAPIVAGVASLVWGNKPSLTAVDVRRILEQSARDVETPGRDHLTGFGIVDAKAALAADPVFFIDADIRSVKPVQLNGQVQVQVLGIADANLFARAYLEIGQGDNPDSWTKVGDSVLDRVHFGEVGLLPAEELAGTTT